MFRVWIAGAAAFSFFFSSASAETFDSSFLTSASTTPTTSYAFSSGINTPTNNATSRFTGQTGIAPTTSATSPAVNPALTLALSPTSQPLNTTLLPVTTVTPITASYDPLQWTDVRRAAALSLGAVNLTSSTSLPALRTAPMLGTPSGGLTVAPRSTR